MKHVHVAAIGNGHVVAPFTGAWIETRLAERVFNCKAVAPFTGAWIETARAGIP